MAGRPLQKNNGSSPSASAEFSIGDGETEEVRGPHEKALAEDPNNILNFTNPLGVSQSDHYKERAIRQRNWAYLLGKPA